MKTLRTPVSFFFDEEGDSPAKNDNRIGLVISGEIMDLPDDKIRKSLYHLIRTINRSCGGQDNEPQ